MDNWLRYIGSRLLWAVVTIFAAVTTNFVLFRLVPGDATAKFAKVPGATPAYQQAIQREFGLDKSKWEQYVVYLKQLVHGNLGVSFQDRQPVAEHLWSAIGNTLPLVVAGSLFALVLGVVSGVYAAYSRGTTLDDVTVTPALAFYAMPVQWLGLILILLMGGLLPTGGMSDAFAIDQGGWGHIVDVGRHMLLPALTFGLVAYGQYTLVVRSAMLEELGEDYVLTARAKGLPRRTILRRHALRNAMLPVSTLIALSIGTLVGGAVLVEAVFSWPGIGTEMYQSVLTRDYPVLQGAFLMLTVSVVLCNLIADIVYLWLDPRVRT
jgi:ABC-type dipeptide/oligopeptide/nickel transport system permease component